MTPHHVSFIVSITHVVQVNTLSRILSAWKKNIWTYESGQGKIAYYDTAVCFNFVQGTKH